ncbi:MAG TPA: radical SAM protein [Candidatus Avacidaminococcus intestinavium]|uniref:Radical SAM protein n=1 Tax=Candidatus Avacidaminococcus intestinavium TaxID=2840684 RepID=A0A9D1MRI3_9FIRM|nr:radical SAM protein [Candidatus Avacidaminococcus intestinavium]
MGSLGKAWQIRKQNFAPELFVARPTQTESISVTGDACALKCAHCGGHYLSKMTPLARLQKAEDIKGTSCLISGGCDLTGKVNVVDKLEHLKSIKGQRRYNFHVGLLNEDEIKLLAPLADVISFDFLGDNETIRETLKLTQVTVEDYVQCFHLLKKYCSNVAPHICIGLRGGQLSGERQALHLLAKAGVERLIFIVLVPTKNTEYATCEPPAIAEVTALLEEARILLPTTPLVLGCMRPPGKYRSELDIAAINSGINGIVQPTPLVIRRAQELGLVLKESWECCVL